MPDPQRATYRLTIEYEGTRYRGWQVQKNAKSVAGELLRALAGAGHEPLELGGSGRTDAGVHALAQVAHLRLPHRVHPEELRRAVNDRLPADVHLVSAVTAPDRFHARHDAVERAYLYQISRRRTAFAKRFVWWVRDDLDLDLVRRAAGRLRGRADYRRFCEQPAAQPSTLVEVAAVEVAEEGDLVLLRFVASHFLWKMVRRLVGTLVQVGAGRLHPDAFAALLDPATAPPGEADPAQWTAPPSGLFLERVRYRGDLPLAPIAAATPVPSPPRRHRTP
jgi:tRNA pseudouridine38-40 synthase